MKNVAWKLPFLLPFLKISVENRATSCLLILEVRLHLSTSIYSNLPNVSRTIIYRIKFWYFLDLFSNFGWTERIVIFPKRLSTDNSNDH